MYSITSFSTNQFGEPYIENPQQYHQLKTQLSGELAKDIVTKSLLHSALSDNKEELKKDTDKAVKNLQDSIANHVKDARALTDVVKIGKNYMSVGNKRIVNVSKSIDRTYAVNRSELDELRTKISDQNKLKSSQVKKPLFHKE